jgi:hypothetical protein
MTEAPRVLARDDDSCLKIYIEGHPDPLWAQALIRLGNATARMSARLEALYSKTIEPGSFVPTCRQLAQDLIDFLDLFEAEEIAPPLDLSSQAEADMLLAHWQANRVLPPHLRLETDQ